MIRLLFLLLLLPAVLPAQANQPSNGENAFTQVFGEPGSTGSFRARFSRAGAGIVWLQAMDHFVSLQAARKAQHESNDYLLLLENGADHALRLWHEPRTPAFPVDPATAVWNYEPIDDGVRFVLDGGNGLRLVKELRHDPGQRGFVLELSLRNESSDAIGTIDFQLGGPVLVNPTESSLFGDVSVAIAVPVEGDTEYVKPQAGGVQALPVNPAALRFAGSTNRFFGAFLWPKDEAAAAALTQFEVDTVPLRDNPDTKTKAYGTTRVRYGLRFDVPPRGGESSVSFGVYLGPKSFRVFDTLPEPERFAAILDIDLNPPCCGIDVPGGRPMAMLLLWLLGVFHDFLGNWGFAIILLTILVRGSMFPLNFHMQKSMRAYGAKMAKLKPKMDELKAKHGDDQKAYQQAMIQFQREHKIIPPVGGCLPIFLTMPIYIGLFTALRTAYDLRQQPFIGWIDDLSRSDELFQLGFWPHAFNLLPLLWIGLFLFLQTRMPLPSDPQQRQMQQMMRYMPMIFGVMLYNYASALLLYMVTSMLWSLVESRIVKKILGPVDPNVGAMAPTPM